MKFRATSKKGTPGANGRAKVPFFQKAKRGLLGGVSGRFLGNGGLIGFLAVGVFFVNFALR